MNTAPTPTTGVTPLHVVLPSTLRAAMSVRGVDIRHLSMTTGIGRARLHRRILLGKGKPLSLSELERIAASLGVRVSSLLESAEIRRSHGTGTEP